MAELFMFEYGEFKTWKRKELAMQQQTKQTLVAISLTRLSLKLGLGYIVLTDSIIWTLGIALKAFIHDKKY